MPFQQPADVMYEQVNRVRGAKQSLAQVSEQLLHSITDAVLYLACALTSSHLNNFATECASILSLI
jgi:hypothetical protein